VAREILAGRCLASSPAAPSSSISRGGSMPSESANPFAYEVLRTASGRRSAS
jgi:hypothetical protein